MFQPFKKKKKTEILQKEKAILLMKLVLEAKAPNLKTFSPMKELTFFLLLKVLKVRLAGAPISNAGRVEVLYAGGWGTIRGWNWDINAAHVVCRQLGYPGVISFGSSYQFGIGNGPSWFENVKCLGNESSFEECSKDTPGYPNDRYSSVATILCKSKPQPGEISIEVNDILYV